MALGFATYLLFMRNSEQVTDDHAALLREKWQRLEPAVLVKDVLSDVTLWGTDLTVLKGFAHMVTVMLGALLNEGVKGLLQRVSGELSEI
jgi:tagaturonate reductase